MELHVLPRRDVTESAGIPFRNVRQRFELRRVNDTLGNLDPQHLGISILTLPVCAAQKPEAPPLVGRDLATLEAIEHQHELIDVGGVRKG